MRRFAATVRMVLLVVAASVACPSGDDIEAAAQPTVASVREPNVLQDGGCEFTSNSEETTPPIARVVVATNLDCEIWVNVEGRDERLRAVPRNTCDRGWDLPGKGERVRRTYRAGVTRVDADYNVTDSCFLGDRCEYIRFGATFRISNGQGTKVVPATGQCSW